jgi:hypothetical protein
MAPLFLIVNVILDYRGGNYKLIYQHFIILKYYIYLKYGINKLV